MKFLKINDEDLLKTLINKAQVERNLTLEIIELLEEVDRRKLFLEQGYGSLLEFCVKVLKYSESAAYRRISAMRVVRDVPEVKQSITEGSLNLVSIAQAQTFINQERKYNHKTYSKEEKKDLILNLENKTKRECERFLMEISPDLPKQEKVRQITETKTQITLTIDQNLIEKLDQLKQKYSHINPNATYAELIEIMATKLLKTQPQQPSKNQNLKQQEPKLLQREDQIKHTQPIQPKIPQTQAPRHTAKPPVGPWIYGNSASSENTAAPSTYNKTPKEESLELHPQGSSQEGLSSKDQQPRKGVSNRSQKTRYIPATIKQEIYMRDKGSCTYTHPRTKRKCESRHQLQIDHKYPYALGGEHTIKNLRLVCRNHNQFYAKRIFNSVLEKIPDQVTSRFCIL